MKTGQMPRLTDRNQYQHDADLTGYVHDFFQIFFLYFYNIWHMKCPDAQIPGYGISNLTGTGFT
jgi:hypothetical protein